MPPNSLNGRDGSRSDGSRSDDSWSDGSWFDERVEAYVDAELSADERVAFGRRLATDARLRAQVALAEQVSLSLAATSQPVCPDSLVARLDAISERAHDSGLRVTPLQTAWRKSAGSSVGIAASILLLIFAGVLAVSNRPQNVVSQIAPETGYTQPEVDQALREVKFALAIVSEAGRHTGAAVMESVFESDVGEASVPAVRNNSQDQTPVNRQ
jgi:anti-sigma factor RsiW